MYGLAARRTPPGNVPCVRLLPPGLLPVTGAHFQISILAQRHVDTVINCKNNAVDAAPGYLILGYLTPGLYCPVFSNWQP